MEEKIVIVKYKNRFLIRRNFINKITNDSWRFEYLAIERGHPYWWGQNYIKHAKKFWTAAGAEKFYKKISEFTVVKTL